MKSMDLRCFTRDEIKEIMVLMEQPKYRGDQVFEWLFKGAESIDDMKTISKDLKDTLKKEGYYLSCLRTVKRIESAIDGTVKFLFELEDKERIESVVLPDKERTTLCISSQVGCACACAFCATGSIGFKRDLTTGEIVDQFIWAQKETGIKIDNVVFMGMGEPMLNWENVKKAIFILNDEKGFHFAQLRVTVSTIGILPAIKEMADKDYRFGLAVSIITANDEVRSKLIPMNKAYPLAEIVKMARYYTTKTERTIMFEYPIFAGINDSIKDADAFYKMMRGIDYKVNLIPYNSVVGREYTKPEIDKVKAFQKHLMEKGVKIFIRKEKGSDIAGACGQLAGAIEYKE
jgi:23S rRNA (adenine2503-C2)-methyltransferase